MSDRLSRVSEFVGSLLKVVRRYVLLVCLLAVAGIMTWYVVAMRSRGPNTAAIAKNFAVILDDASTAEEADQSIAYFRTQPTDWKVEFAAREFAKNLPEDLGWIQYRQLRGSRDIPKPYRRTCLLWRVMRDHYRGGSPSGILQRLAPQPDFLETAWKLVRHLPNSPEDVAHFKGSLLHGLMEERRLKLAQMKLEIPVKNVPPENPALIRLTGDLIAETPGESMDSAYFLALQYGEYIGVDFMPDSKRPEYKGPNGLNKHFFRSRLRKPQIGGRAIETVSKPSRSNATLVSNRPYSMRQFRSAGSRRYAHVLVRNGCRQRSFTWAPAALALPGS